MLRLRDKLIRDFRLNHRLRIVPPIQIHFELWSSRPRPKFASKKSSRSRCALKIRQRLIKPCACGVAVGMKNGKPATQTSLGLAGIAPETLLGMSKFHPAAHTRTNLRC